MLTRMRRNGLTRPAAILFAIVLVLGLGEPGIVDACPIHGNIGLWMGRDTAPDMVHAGAHHGGSPTDSKHQGKDCHCLGLCTSGVVVALLPTTPLAQFSATEVSTETADYTAPAASAPAAPHSRPFSTGPPRA